jgi:hypothetical protein
MLITYRRVNSFHVNFKRIQSNPPLLNSNSHSQTQDFVDNCFTNGCIPMINKPTRITQNTTDIHFLSF